MVFMSDDVALKTLKLRYTNGEIDRKTYLQMKDDLESDKDIEPEKRARPTKQISNKSPHMLRLIIFIVVLLFLLVFVYFALQTLSQVTVSTYQCEQSFWYQVGLKQC